MIGKNLELKKKKVKIFHFPESPALLVCNAGAGPRAKFIFRDPLISHAVYTTTIARIAARANYLYETRRLTDASTSLATCQRRRSNWSLSETPHTQRHEVRKWNHLFSQGIAARLSLTLSFCTTPLPIHSLSLSNYLLPC